MMKSLLAVGLCGLSVALEGRSAAEASLYVPPSADQAHHTAKLVESYVAAAKWYTTHSVPNVEAAGLLATALHMNPYHEEARELLEQVHSEELCPWGGNVFIKHSNSTVNNMGSVGNDLTTKKGRHVEGFVYYAALHTVYPTTAEIQAAAFDQGFQGFDFFSVYSNFGRAL